MDCQEFTKKVELVFDYLFQTHGFSLVQTLSSSERTDYCLLGLENSVSRVIIYQAREEANVWIGPLQAPFSWDLQGYFSARNLLRFILKQPFQLPDFNTFPSIEEQLSDLSKDLQPYMSKLLDLFIEDKFENWQVDYDDFQENQRKVILKLVE